MSSSDVAVLEEAAGHYVVWREGYFGIARDQLVSRQIERVHVVVGWIERVDVVLDAGVHGALAAGAEYLIQSVL